MSEPDGTGPATTPPRRAAVNVSTVLASAGVAALVSVLIVAIGVAGVALGTGNGSGDSASAQVPTVVNLGAAAQQQTPGAQAPAAQAPGTQTPGAAPAPGSGPAAAPAPAAEPVPESGGGGDSGPAPGVPAQAPAAQTPQAAAAPAPLTPGQLNAGQLNTKIKLILNTGAPRAARASELQAGERALPPVDTVANMLNVYRNSGFSYQVIGPVTQNGTTLNATLQMSLVGQGSRYRPLSWVWMDGKWKLSNTSVCTIAAYAMIPCPV
ncbi:hypothetical protein ACWDTD_19075 [Gordonia sp. NPDC003425]